MCFTCTGFQPDWAASVCRATPRSRHTAPMASRSCTTPISLLTAITLTHTVSSRRAAATSSGSTMPWPSTGSTVAPIPSRSSCATGSSTALCSVARVTTWDPRPARFAARASPSSARLFDSVAPLVNTISLGEAPRKAATWPRAVSVARRASMPMRWPRLAALPKRCCQWGAIASTTSSAQGVVAWWSK